MDRVAEWKKLMSEAAENGWTHVGGGHVFRATVHQTPAEIKAAGWWDQDTFSCIEILDFVFVRQTGLPISTYQVHVSPWVTASSHRLSYRKALALLAQPLADSDIHNR